MAKKEKNNAATRIEGTSYVKSVPSVSFSLDISAVGEGKEGGERFTKEEREAIKNWVAQNIEKIASIQRGIRMSKWHDILSGELDTEIMLGAANPHALDVRCKITDKTVSLEGLAVAGNELQAEKNSFRVGSIKIKRQFRR
jgi:hypothetical protein